ncbi:MAG: AAA family ATPase [Paludibacter sp.]|nr:AAA family ATPase [Paludibacter sp.]
MPFARKFKMSTRSEIQELKRQIKSVIFVSGAFGIIITEEGDKLKGSFLTDPYSLVGQELVFSGKWEEHPKYGKSFSFSNYSEPPMDNGTFVFYFLSNMVKGIGEKIAKEIIKKFGDSTSSVLENAPEKLLTISGIKHQKLETIIQSWQEQKHLRQLSEKYSSTGISNAMIQKVYESWGANAISILENNPYRLTDIPGIGFKKADEVARLIGIKSDAPERIASCIVYCFEKYMADSGHSAILKSDVYKFFASEITIEEGDAYTPDEMTFTSAIDKMCKQKILVEYQDGSMSTAKYDKMERYIHEKLSMAGEDRGEILDRGIDDSLEREEIKLGEKQKLAIQIANVHPKCFVVTGGAGSGKTTVSKYILKLFEKNYGYDTIACCALSGVAANRIKNQSGYASQTIHSLLGANGTGFEHNEGNPLAKKVILLDEAAMVGVDIFYALIKAIDFHNTTLVLLGDHAQLPPIGAGNVFSDLIRHNIVPAVTLDKIYRQDEKKGVAIVANQIREGVIPNVEKDEYDDFYFLDQSITDYWKKRNSLTATDFDLLKQQNADMIAKVITLAAKKIAPQIHAIGSSAEKIAFFQILSPMKDGTLGVNRLNKNVQNAINPLTAGHPFITVRDTDFRMGDKVIHLANKPMKIVREERFAEYLRTQNNDLVSEQRVFNGQIGIIKSVDIEDGSFFVEYPSEKYYTLYTRKEIEAGVLDLAYAISVHKSQGSEFKNVVIPVSLSHYIMLSPQLMYTAITRAKEKLFLVGDSNALSMACKKREGMERKTVIGVIQDMKSSGTTYFAAPKKGEQLEFSMKSNPTKIR